ncbi:AbiTii domain-containing protein [Tenacibaculum xiamenense]|uniref:AbiTii domain-containing protein n=1 Tax=Tenacibaculum xiamenense TaxID=1261553 RepID=UPI003895F4E5
MKLISQIINELIESEKSINGALLKTKVLASRIQNKELLDWVNRELNGYSSTKDLPEYRKNITSYLKGNYVNGNVKYTNQPIPTIGLDEIFQKKLQSTEFQDSITALENLINKNDSSTLASPLRAEIVGMIEENWIEMGNPYLQLMNVSKIISKSAIVEVVSKVRNKLLDFMLKVDEEFGGFTEIKDLKEKQKEISTIMNQTIINTSGDGNVVNTGDKNKVNAKIIIEKGNKDALAKRLQENGVSEQDTAELIKIIDTEEPNSENKTFGKKVNDWTKKMIGKAVDGSWNIGLGAAGSLLAEAIGKYYGI